MKVLLVEDDYALRMVWEDALTDGNYNYTSAGTTSEGMRALMTEEFDVVVLDLLLAEGNSLSLTHYIAYAMPLVPIIVVTGSGFFPNGELGPLAPNVDWLLRKPLPVSDFIAMVDHAAHVSACRKSAKPDMIDYTRVQQA